MQFTFSLLLNDRFGLLCWHLVRFFDNNNVNRLKLTLPGGPILIFWCRSKRLAIEHRIWRDVKGCELDCKQQCNFCNLQKLCLMQIFVLDLCASRQSQGDRWCLEKLIEARRSLCDDTWLKTNYSFLHKTCFEFLTLTVLSTIKGTIRLYELSRYGTRKNSYVRYENQLNKVSFSARKDCQKIIQTIERFHSNLKIWTKLREI